VGGSGSDGTSSVAFKLKRRCRLRFPFCPFRNASPWERCRFSSKTLSIFWSSKLVWYRLFLLFEPLRDSRIPSQRPSVSETPKELIVVSIEPTITKAVLDALRRVEAREPEYPSETKRRTLKLKENTPFKGVFRQMAEVSLTVFSINPPEEAEAISIFFLRTPFTVSEFRKEIEVPI